MLSILTIKKYACWAYWGYRYYNIKVHATTSNLVYDLPVILHNFSLKGRSGSCLVMSDYETSWTADHQSSLSMGFSRQEYWSGLPFPSPGDLINQVQILHHLSHQGSPVYSLDEYRQQFTRWLFLRPLLKPPLLLLASPTGVYSTAHCDINDQEEFW